MLNCKVSIIIVNYKTSQLVVDSIRSVKKSTEGISYELIVVDNNSQDEIESILKNNFGDEIKCILLRDNLGFGLANNEGFKIAEGEYLFCLNPDTVLLNNAIKILADYLDTHPSVGICGGNLYDSDMQPAHSFKRLLPGIRSELCEISGGGFAKLLYGDSYEFNHTEHPMSVGYICGADMIIRRKVAEHVGGYSREFFMYYEDTDLCYKVKKAGFGVMSVPQAKTLHLEGKSFTEEGTVKQHRFNLSEKSKLVYMQKNMPSWKVSFCRRIGFLGLSFLRWYFSRKGNPIWKMYEARIDAIKKVCVPN